MGQSRVGVSLQHTEHVQCDNDTASLIVSVCSCMSAVHACPSAHVRIAGQPEVTVLTSTLFCAISLHAQPAGWPLRLPRPICLPSSHSSRGITRLSYLSGLPMGSRDPRWGSRTCTTSPEASALGNEEEFCFFCVPAAPFIVLEHTESLVSQMFSHLPMITVFTHQSMRLKLQIV